MQAGSCTSGTALRGSTGSRSLPVAMLRKKTDRICRILTLRNSELEDVNHFLVGGLEHVFFHSVGIFIIPTDEVHHFSEG